MKTIAAMMANYKTTAAGLALIFGAVTDITHSLASGQPPHLEADMAAIMSGIGLLFAHDGTPKK